MLFQRVDLLSRRIRGNEAVIVDGEDILLFGDHITEASAGGVLEGNAGSFGAENPVDVISVVQFVVETLGHRDFLRGISVLHNDEMVWLEKGSPHLQKIQISYCGDDNVKLIFQNRGRRNCCCHCCNSSTRGLWTALLGLPVCSARSADAREE
eukprot:TRINITY_DN360_c0_g1_i2.p2 TRINITY_DN360_c0_g1~~TRINITY_DN360_c0_g1_i2.p2  ORF type:complete len:153 (-),score=22.06 TRINITY_DN360_c0_g1_i2:107-565(-)